MRTLGPVRLLARRWYLYLAALLVCAAVVAGVPSHPRAVAVGAEVTLVPPVESPAGTLYPYSLESMLAFTAAVDRAYDAQFPSVPLSSPSASFFGNHVREGVSVGAATDGNQWQQWQSHPAIMVRATAGTQDGALALLHEAIGRVEAVTESLQVDSEVPVAQRVRAVWDERGFTVETVSSSPTGTIKGAAVLCVVALLIATALAGAWERASTRRERVPTETPSTPIEMSR